MGVATGYLKCVHYYPVLDAAVAELGDGIVSEDLWGFNCKGGCSKRMSLPLEVLWLGCASIIYCEIVFIGAHLSLLP